MAMGSRMVVLWLSVAGLFAGLLGVAESSRNPKDDPDLAYQRTGTLLPSETLPAPSVLPDYPRPGHRMAVLFIRSAGGRVLFHDLAFQSDLDVLADVVLVTADGGKPEITQGFSAIVADRSGEIAAAYGLRTPRDGGYPVGYALVDRRGFIRHRTLDPHCVGMGHSIEIKALLGALP
jgi:hypothetical protein